MLRRIFFSRRFLFRKIRVIALVVLGLLASSTLVYLWARPFGPTNPAEAATQRALPTRTLTSTTAPTATQTPVPTATPVPGIWVSPALPAEWTARLAIPAGWTAAADPATARLRVSVGGVDPIAQWVYALVAPFPTVTDGIAEAQLKSAWQGNAPAPFTGLPLLLSQNTLDVLTARWGAPVPGAVRVIPEEELIGAACDAHIEARWDYTIRPAWGIIPFGAITPSCKVLAVDGISPMRNEFQPDRYALTMPISVDSLDPEGAALASHLAFPKTNRDAAKFTTLILTGVTAMVRHTAVIMEEQGVLYPGLDVADVLRAADITHISNEIAFYDSCPKPKKYMGPIDLVFCSHPSYIQLLEFVGADVIELTGNHMNDTIYLGDPTGSAFVSTMAMYRERGWPYYGGGATLEEARRPAVIEHNGNRLAFVGCNPVGPEFAWALPGRPGSAPCANPENTEEPGYLAMKAEIRRLRAEGYLPVATFQYYEYNNYQPYPHQRAAFEGMIESGAVIASGSQAHHTQGFGFFGSGFIHYGLGNLFFDQYALGPAFQESTVDRHVFYDGRYLGLEILTMQFVDAARPRWMTPQERAAFLKKLFVCSGWKEKAWEECPTIL